MASTLGDDEDGKGISNWMFWLIGSTMYRLAEVGRLSQRHITTIHEKRSRAGEKGDRGRVWTISAQGFEPWEASKK
jgi:hypothetical protein